MKGERREKRDTGKQSSRTLERNERERETGEASESRGCASRFPPAPEVDAGSRWSTVDRKDMRFSAYVSASSSVLASAGTWSAMDEFTYGVAINADESDATITRCRTR